MSHRFARAQVSVARFHLRADFVPQARMTTNAPYAGCVDDLHPRMAAAPNRAQISSVGPAHLPSTDTGRVGRQRGASRTDLLRRCCVTVQRGARCVWRRVRLLRLQLGLPASDGVSSAPLPIRLLCRTRASPAQSAAAGLSWLEPPPSSHTAGAPGRDDDDVSIPTSRHPRGCQPCT